MQEQIVWLVTIFYWFKKKKKLVIVTEELFANTDWFPVLSGSTEWDHISLYPE